jgi:arylsulfatase A-like enzyme
MSQIPRHPNILLIMADQFRGDCLSIDGHPHLMTPVLDSLAQDGIRFRHAYSPCPTCVPARRCLLTGLTPASTGVTGMDDLAMRQRILTPTLPAMLRDAGYQTASVGRGMHQFPTHARYGFETFVEDPFAEVYSTIHRDVFRPSRNGPFGNWPHQNGGISGNGARSRPWPHDERYHETNWSVAKAIEFLDHRDREAPFFLHVGFVAPHPPLLPPAAYLERYQAMALEAPRLGDWADDHPWQAAGTGPHFDAPWSGLGLDGRWNQAARAGYFGLINHLDDQIAALLTRVRMEGEDTCVIFTSDHGEMLGDHHWFKKALPFEGSARIPLLLSGPGLPKGLVCDEAVDLVDILPTACDLAGIPIPAWAEGVSLARAAREGTGRAWIHGENAGSDERGHHVITDGRRKFIWFVQGGREYFFDLEKDPHEMRNLVRDPARRDEVATWRGRLIGRLSGRPEGFTDGQRLIADVPYPRVVPGRQ